MKKIIASCTAALALAALSACGSDTPGKSGDSAKDGVAVTLWHGLDGVAATSLDKLVAEFNAGHQGKIKASAIYQGKYPDVLAKYSAAIRDKGTPSVLMSYDVSTGYLADAGQTVPAGALATAKPGIVPVDDLRPAARNYYTVKGELLSVPFNTSTPLMYVNTDLLKKAGLPEDAPLDTLADVAAVAKTVAEKVPGVKGIDQPFDGWWFEQLTAAAGESYCAPDNGRNGTTTTALKLTGPAQSAAIKTMADLYTSGAALDTGVSGGDAIKAFQAGKVAMIFGSSGAAGTVKSGATFAYKAMPYPVSGSKTDSGPIIGGASLWVNGPGHSDAEQTAAWQLIGFLTSAKAQEAFAQQTGYVPVNKQVDASPGWQTFLESNPVMKAAVDQLNGVPVTPATAGCLTGALPNVRTAVVSGMQGAFTGQTPLDDALKSTEAAANTHIAQYRKQAGQ